ncbi:hypothetical protein [Actinomyces howellii]|uniref:DUF559 domain-containing protein n=1 Tax=Actinomyces howellii TaxID=52771 RepID=A0A448HHX1_9ACTO|nr:hypothetical protein [Actinomyces howellii]VEG28840.1 Uncharacterised protein [Actinomyces howellii]
MLIDSLRRSHGALKQRFLAPDHCSRRALSRMLSDGCVLRHPNHVIALPQTGPRIVTARRLGGLIGCSHALEHHGIDLRERPGRLHVLVPKDPGTTVHGIGRVTVHRVPGLPVDPAGSPFADPESSLLTFMRCAEELDALIALDSALRAGAVTRRQLLAALPGRRNGPMRALLDRADPRARSPLETIARYDLQEAGAPPEVAVTLPVGEVDLMLGPLLVIETDGYAYHSSWEDWNRDRLRDQRLAAEGRTVLRLTSRQVLGRQTVRIVRPVARRLGCWPSRA